MRDLRWRERGRGGKGIVGDGGDVSRILEWSHHCMWLCRRIWLTWTSIHDVIYGIWFEWNLSYFLVGWPLINIFGSDPLIIFFLSQHLVAVISSSNQHLKNPIWYTQIYKDVRTWKLLTIEKTIPPLELFPNWKIMCYYQYRYYWLVLVSHWKIPFQINLWVWN